MCDKKIKIKMKVSFGWNKGITTHTLQPMETKDGKWELYDIDLETFCGPIFNSYEELENFITVLKNEHS